MIDTKLELAKALDTYIKEKHTQEECTGFIEGFEKADSLFAKRIVGKSFFKRCKIGFQKWYLNWFIAEAKYRFKNKPNTLKLAKRYRRYKLYLLNK